METASDKHLGDEFTHREEETPQDTLGQLTDQGLTEPEVDPADLSLRHSAFGPNQYGDFDS